MTQNNTDISPLVRRLLPDASLEEQREATENFRAYIAVLYRIYRRLEAEGKLGSGRDKKSEPAMVYTNKNKCI